MKKDYIPGVNMHEDCCVKTDEEIAQVVKAAAAVTVASEKRKFFEQKDGSDLLRRTYWDS